MGEALQELTEFREPVELGRCRHQLGHALWSEVRSHHPNSAQAKLALIDSLEQQWEGARGTRGGKALQRFVFCEAVLLHAEGVHGGIARAEIELAGIEFGDANQELHELGAFAD